LNDGVRFRQLLYRYRLPEPIREVRQIGQHQHDCEKATPAQFEAARTRQHRPQSRRHKDEQCKRQTGVPKPDSPLQKVEEPFGRMQQSSIRKRAIRGVEPLDRCLAVGPDPDGDAEDETEEYERNAPGGDCQPSGRDAFKRLRCGQQPVCPERS